MSAYAAGTTVAADRSRIELERLLRRFGATGFAYGWQSTPTARESVGFEMHGRQVRIELPIPASDSVEFTVTPGGKRRSETAARDAYDAEIRRRWRSLVLVVKAKLTAVADGISTVEREFLADVVLPSGATFGQWAASRLPEIDRGSMPELLPGADR